MLNRKILILIIAITIIVVLGAAVYLVVNKDEPVKVAPPADREIPALGQLPDGEPVVEPRQAVKKQELSLQEQDKLDIVNMTKFFVGMLGTYSPDAKFRNIQDLKPMMTDKMQNWADGFMVRNLPNIKNQSESVTTTVFKTEIISYGAKRAIVEADARREKINSQGQKLYSQQVEVRLVKAGEKWLVDEVIWK